MNPSRRAWKIGGIYALFGFLWILLSDHLLEWFAPDMLGLSNMQTWKGLFYVAVTAYLVVTLSRRAFAEQEELLRRSRLSEDRLRAIFDGVGDVILLHDPESGRILEANSLTESLFGYAPAEIIGRDANALSQGEPPYTGEEALAHVRRAATGEEPFFHWRVRRKDGNLVWVDVRLRRAELAGQRVVLALVHDVTERMAAEEALRESEERFRALFEQASVGVLLYDREERRIVRANQRFCEILGSSPEELTGTDVRSLQRPEFREANHEGVASLLRGERREHRLEQRLQRRDGSLVWVDLSFTALHRSAGPPRHLVVVAQDVTTRRQAEAALRESEERYRLLFDANPLPMWVFDRESLAFLAVNNAAVAHYGWSRAEFLSMRISDIRPPEELPALLEQLQQIPEGREEVGVWRHLKKSGEEIQVEITAHTVDFALHQAVLVLSLDVTERLRARRRLEESEERLRLALMATGQGLYDMDLAHGTGIISPEYALMLGYEEAEQKWTLQEWLESMHPEDQVRAAPYIQDYLAGRRSEHRVEFRQRTRTGEWRRMLSVGRALERDEQGRPRRLIGTQTDVTTLYETELALRFSQQRFREIFDSIHEAVLIHDAESGDVLQVNRRACELYGVPAEELLGTSAIRYSSGEPGYTGEEAWNWLQRARLEGPQTFEWRARTGDGRVFWVEVTLRLALLEGRERILAVVRDISERKAAAEALLESETRYHQLFRSLVTGFALHEVLTDEAGQPVDYRFLEMNPAFEEMTGLRSAEILGHTVREVLPEVEKEWIRRYGAVALTGQPDRFARYSPEVGRHFDILAYSPRAGQFAVLLQDQSELRRMVEELRESGRRLELLHEVDSAILLELPVPELQRQVLDNLLELVPCPRASLVLFDEPLGGEVVCVAGEDPQLRGPGTRVRLWPEHVEILRRNQDVLVAGPEDYPGLKGLHGELFKAGLATFLHVPLICGDELLGTLNLARPAGLSFSPREREIALELSRQLALALRQHGLSQKVARHAAELEARVVERTQQLQAANAELEAFAYSVSHDLRSPLRAVDGFSRMLEEDHSSSLAPEALRLLHVIRDSTRQMDQLIADLLALSRVTRAELDCRQVEMEPLVREAFQAVRAEEKDGSCQLVLGSLPQAWADPGLLRQVWLNLLGNAVKFSRHSEVKRVEVTAEAAGDEWRFQVRDEGAGFDPAYSHKLFGVFQRLHAAREYEGTGVGLALVQRIICKHGGRVEASGDPGRGATIRFTLPFPQEET